MPLPLFDRCRFSLAMITFTTGLAFVLLSCVLGNAMLQYTHDGITQQTGYLVAPNWTIAPLLFFPLLAAFCEVAYLRFQRAVDTQISLKMFRDAGDPKRIKAMSADKVWERLDRCRSQGFTAWIVFTGIGILESAWEAWANSGKPLLQGAKPEEIDWSVAPLLDSSVSTLGTVAFTFGAFILVQGAMIATIAYFVVTVVTVGRFYLQFVLERHLALVPGLASADKRLGFESLESWGVLTMSGCTVLIFGLYTSITQNTYLRERYSNIYEFIFLPVRQAAEAGRGKMDWHYIVEPDFILNYSSGWVYLAGIFLIIITLFVIPALALSYCAFSAKKEYPEKMMLPNERSDANAQKVDQMRIWPYHYLRLNVLIAFSIVLVGSLFFYRLAPYLFGLALVASVGSLIKEIRKTSNATPADNRTRARKPRRSA